MGSVRAALGHVVDPANTACNPTAKEIMYEQTM